MNNDLIAENVHLKEENRELKDQIEREAFMQDLGLILYDRKFIKNPIEISEDNFKSIADEMTKNGWSFNRVGRG